VNVVYYDGHQGVLPGLEPYARNLLKHQVRSLIYTLGPGLEKEEKMDDLLQTWTFADEYQRPLEFFAHDRLPHVEAFAMFTDVRGNILAMEHYSGPDTTDLKDSLDELRENGFFD
jgi:hypothetical protein